MTSGMETLSNAHAAGASVRCHAAQPSATQGTNTMPLCGGLPESFRRSHRLRGTGPRATSFRYPAWSLTGVCVKQESVLRRARTGLQSLPLRTSQETRDLRHIRMPRPGERSQAPVFHIEFACKAFSGRVRSVLVIIAEGFFETFDPPLSCVELLCDCLMSGLRLPV